MHTSSDPLVAPRMSAPSGIFTMVRSFDFVSSWISAYWEIAWETRDRTGDRSGDLDGDLLGVFFLVLWYLHLFRISDISFL